MNDRHEGDHTIGRCDRLSSIPHAFAEGTQAIRSLCSFIRPQRFDSGVCGDPIAGQYLACLPDGGEAHKDGLRTCIDVKRRAPWRCGMHIE